MNIAWPELLARLGADAVYVSAFRAAYPDGLTKASVLDALASFERSLDTPNSRFDRYLRGDRSALTDAEQEGYALFEQVVVNLVMNALEALAGPERGGEVRTAPDRGQNAAVLEVRDEGVGIPAEHIARLCD